MTAARRGSTSQAKIYEDVRLTPADPVVLQVSRWDHLKDPEGVIRGFAEHASAHETGAHLIYAGPAVEAVSDDPEGAQVLEEAIELRESLSDEARRNVHLVCLPMDDAEENAVIVNALQRNASVVVQKSIAEGFGLTVAEAMWKGRPIVATAVGGIQDQVVDGETGVLLADAHDLDAYGEAVRGLLEDPERAQRMGEAAKQRVRTEFLGARSLIDYLGADRPPPGLTRGEPPARRAARPSRSRPRRGARAGRRRARWRSGRASERTVSSGPFHACRRLHHRHRAARVARARRGRGARRRGREAPRTGRQGSSAATCASPASAPARCRRR